MLNKCEMKTKKIILLGPPVYGIENCVAKIEAYIAMTKVAERIDSVIKARNRISELGIKLKDERGSDS